MRRTSIAIAACIATASPASAQSAGCFAEECHGQKVDVAAGAESFETEIFVATGGGKARPVGGSDGGCAGCTYVLVPACSANEVSGGQSAAPVIDDGVMCGPAAFPCADATLFNVYRRRPGEAYERVDAVCIGPSTPLVRRGDIEAAVQRYVGSLRPRPARIGMQPAGGTLVNFETVFHAAEQPSMTGVVDAGETAGIVVTVTATPTSWEWVFEGDTDNSVHADTPGGPHPDHAAAHWYRRAIERETVTLVTTWTATYSIAGIAGEQPVPGDGVRVPSSVTFPVYESRSDLVAGGS